MKKRNFVRALWGIREHNEVRELKRRNKISNDIRLVKDMPFQHDFRVYVFGKENYEKCSELGFDCKLIHDEPFAWDPMKRQYRHKLEVFKRAMEDYDEAIFLDWDTVPVQDIPENFWEKFYEKEEIQTTLNRYHKKKAPWRRGDERKLSCAAFVYMREKSIPDGIIEEWDGLAAKYNKLQLSEEIAMSRYIDFNYGGWKGTENYWEKHDTYWFSLPKCYWTYPEEKILNEKGNVFRHFDKRKMQYLINEMKKNNLKSEEYILHGLKK